MAAAKKPPAVLVRHDEEGDMFQLGFELNGVFVPVAQVNGGFARALASSPEPEPASADEQESEG